MSVPSRLLIVDDHTGIRSLLIEVFQLEGYITLAAANGVEALQQLNDYEVDFVLLDLDLPTINGLQVIDHLRSKPNCIPHAIITSYDQEVLVERLIRARGNKVFAKPFDIDALKSYVNLQLVNR